jgi:hypothetical protein
MSMSNGSLHYTCSNGPAGSGPVTRHGRGPARARPSPTRGVPGPVRSNSRVGLGLAVGPAVQARARHG